MAKDNSMFVLMICTHIFPEESKSQCFRIYVEIIICAQGAKIENVLYDRAFLEGCEDHLHVHSYHLDYKAAQTNHHPFLLSIP